MMAVLGAAFLHALWNSLLKVGTSRMGAMVILSIGEIPIALAHSLAGSSSTVGFQALSFVARLLEASMHRTQALAWATPQHATTYADVAEDIRRLLHQFAAGFLHSPPPELSSRKVVPSSAQTCATCWLSWPSASTKARTSRPSGMTPRPISLPTSTTGPGACSSAIKNNLRLWIAWLVALIAKRPA